MRGILKKVSVALAVMFATVGLAPKAEAALVQIGSFQSALGNYTYSSGSLTGTTTGTYNFDPGFVALFPALSTTTYTNVSLQIDADATANATQSGPFVTQTMSGFIIITDLSTNQTLLQTTFTNALLSGLANSFSVALFGSTGTGTTITYNSQVFNAGLLTTPRDFTFALNPTSSAIALSNGNFANFSGPDTANFSTTVQTPEPASLALFGLGLTVAGALARKRRRK
jgi:hypothetical protein